MQQHDTIVGNAGLILLAPFLLHFMRRLGLLNELDEFANDTVRSMGIRALARLSDMEDPLEEKALALNKLLLGWTSPMPVTSLERPGYLENVDFRYERLKLLQSVITKWGVADMTTEMLIRDFIAREGRLSGERLIVLPKPQDIVLRSVPWAISLIQLPPMPKPLQVHWEIS